jgi:hypothetical protein
MPWNSTFPNGALSVKANETPGQENTTYIETTMGNDPVGTNTAAVRDHFWDVGSDEDGHHRFIQSVGFTVGSDPEDPVLGTGMDSVLYAKEVSDDVGRVEWFHRNAQGIYQFIPTFLEDNTGVSISSSFVTVAVIPEGVYGEIFMFTTIGGKYSTITGHFRSTDTIVEAWAHPNVTSSSSSSYALEFANGSDAVDLNLKAKRHDASSGQTWFTRITFRAL